MLICYFSLKIRHYQFHVVHIRITNGIVTYDCEFFSCLKQYNLAELVFNIANLICFFYSPITFLSRDISGSRKYNKSVDLPQDQCKETCFVVVQLTLPFNALH